MFDHPLWLWFLLATPLVALPGWWLVRRRLGLLPVLSVVLRVTCFALVIVTLAGGRFPIRDTAHRMTLVVALDQSRSIAPDQRAWMLSQLSELRSKMETRDRLAVIGFGRDARMLVAPGDPRLASPMQLPLDDGATDIAGALATAAGVFASDTEKRILLLSDGNETQGDARREVPSLSYNDIRIYAGAPPPSHLERVAITRFDAPDAVRADSSFALRLDVESEAQQPAPATIRLFADDRVVGGREITLMPGLNRLRLPYRIERSGGYLMKATIAVTPPVTAINPAAETAIAVTAPPHVLMISSNPSESLVQVLKLRGYDVAATAPRGLPRRAEDYVGYQAVIIANTPAEALDEEAQQALNRYVADYGGGLIVLGDSLRDSHFHDGPLEKALPISFVPQPPPPSREPIAVYLLIDRSNSMSYNSRYPAVRDGERIRYAKQAAMALLKQLDDTDLAGVIAFDSEPYVIGHLRPLGDDREQLRERVDRLQPGGGTDFKEALEIAGREILQSGIAVRQVILLTDGDTNRQYHDHDQLMAEFARQGIPISTIRIGPDLENLRLLQDFAHATGGIFYRVEDITKLPQLLVHLTHEAQNFKRHEKPRVEETAQSAILNGINPTTIPPIDFVATTEAKDGAMVPLTAHKGRATAPLLAAWQYELGRAAIFSGDPDSLGSLEWLRWDHYTEFWSQLVSWVAREGDAGPFTLEVHNTPEGTLAIAAEKDDAAPVERLFCRITGPSRVADIALTQVGPSRYAGESAPLARGKYNLALMFKVGDTERVLLRRQAAGIGAEQADSAELKLKPTNTQLLHDLSLGTRGRFGATITEILAHNGTKTRIWQPIERFSIPAAILLLLADVWLRRRVLDD